MKNKAILLTLALMPSALSALPPVETVYLNNGDVYFGYIQEYNTESDIVTFIAEKGLYHLSASDLSKLEDNMEGMSLKPVESTGEFATFFKESPKMLASMCNPEKLKVYDLGGESKDKWGRRVILAGKDAEGATILSVVEATKKFEYSQMDSITREAIDINAPLGLYDIIVTQNSNQLIGINTLTIPGESFEMVLLDGTRFPRQSLDNMAKKGKQCKDTDHDFIYNSPLLTEISYDGNGGIKNITGVVVMDDYEHGTIEIYPLEGSETLKLSSDKIKSKVSKRNPYFGKERQTAAATAEAAVASSEKAGPSVGVVAEKLQPEDIAALATEKKADPLAGATRKPIEELINIQDERGLKLLFIKYNKDMWDIPAENVVGIARIKLNSTRSIALEFSSPKAPITYVYKVQPQEKGNIKFSKKEFTDNSAFVKEIEIDRKLSEADFGEPKSAILIKDLLPNSYYIIRDKDSDAVYLIHTI